MMMSLMSRLLTLVVIATLSVSARSSADEVKSYVKERMIQNKQVKVTKVDIIDSKVLDEPKGWEVFFINIHANVKKGPTIFDKVTVPETLFVKDGYTVPTLINLKTGEDLKLVLKPDLKPNVYDDKHLIAGNRDAKHKLVIFTDPMCPFCREKIPEIYKAVKENPETFALYYYHLPLLRIHPVSDIITRAMQVAKAKGIKQDKLMELYKLKVEPRETNATKVLGEIKKQFGIDVTEKEINEDKISKEIIFDRDMATQSMVTGTPTLYIDGKWDPSRNEYKKLIKNN